MREASQPADEPDKDEKRTRFRRRARIFVGLSLVLSTFYVAFFWFDRLFVSPQELYRRAFQVVAENIYDQSRLADMSEYKAIYEKEVKTTADAVRYANLLFKRLDDPFTQMSDAPAVSRREDASKGFYSGVGMVMTAKKRPVKVRMVMEDSPALKAGIKPGDEILFVDGMDCMKIPVSEIGDHTRKHMGETVHFVLRRAKKTMNVDLVPSKIRVVKTRTRHLPGDIGYERIESFVPEDIVTIVQNDLDSLSDTRALILDMRGNPGGSVDYCLLIASLLMDEGHLVTLKSRVDADHLQTMEYTLRPDGMKVVTTGTGEKPQEQKIKRRYQVYGGRPIYVLLDESSASASEMLAAALRDNKKAIICGTQSFGKGVMQIHYPLPNMTALSITAGRYFTPAGKWLGDGKFDPARAALAAASGSNSAARFDPERGIVPDVVIEPVPDIEYGGPNDNQLEETARLARLALEKKAKPAGEQSNISVKKLSIVE